VAAGDKPNIPRVVAGTDIRSLPIGPLEGFVLTRMDGALGVDAIADMTGQDVEQVRAAVERLVALGAAEWVDGPPPPPPPPAAAPTGADFGMADTVPPPPIQQDPPVQEAPRAAAAADTRPELQEDVDLPMERRVQVLDVFERLGELDYYGILGVGRDASKEEIRAAYFRLSKAFHPDSLYGKRLGSFKAKMEKVFHRLTEAYETLGKKRKREAYDEYLGLVSTTRAVEERRAETHAQVKAMGGAGDTPTPPRQSNPDVRRQLFARQVGAATGGRPSSAPGPSSTPPPLTPPASDRKAALRDLARSLAEASHHAPSRAQLDRMLDEAKKAEQEGDLAEAANALRLALAVAPKDVEVRAEHDRVQARLARSLCETYRRQALYEEETGQWAAAVLSWLRVVDGQPEAADPHRRAAVAILQAQGDLRRARNLAQRAVELEPANVRNRVVLGQVYRAAGMRLNALREVQEAAKLDPEDEIVKNLLRELGS
jgi:curved DNA-binding protein CbpA